MSIHDIPAPRAGQGKITEPGIYNLPTETYLRDPVHGGSLSATGIEHLTAPNTPAHFNEWRQRPPKPTQGMNFGSATHTLILGAGNDVVAFPEHDGRTKEGKAIRADMETAKAEGKYVVSESELETITIMRDTLRNHPWASALLNPEQGTPEQAMIWQDPDTGVMCRSLVDFLRKPLPDGRLFLVDYKTADSADPTKFGRKAWDYGYATQRAQYVAGGETLHPGANVDFIFIVQEKRAPYLVNCIRLDADAIQIGNYLRHKALDTYAECTQRGEWPGYPLDINTAPTPGYIQFQYPEVIS